ncbi:integrin alpha pat-2-like [Diadema antillarum]|uniref:integrin alpha pat-2-like n=1 Tax=Diadema antillarum TaxID=105358 RepID=UPI003A853447
MEFQQQWPMARSLQVLKLLLCMLVAVVLQEFVSGFNVDTSRPIIYRHDDNRSQFGFAFTLYKAGDDYKIIVGAPRAESSAFDRLEVYRSGAIFDCPIEVASDTTPECQEFVVDNVGNEIISKNSQTFQVTNASSQWLGSTVQSAGDGGPIVVCRPLYKKLKNVGTFREERTYFGGCFVIGDGLSTVTPFEPCKLDKALGHFLTHRCEIGLSAAVRGDYILHGAPGSQIWEGSTWYTLSNIDEDSPYFYLPQGHRSQYSREFYFGYSVAFGNFKGDSVTEFAISQPRYRNGYGRVLLYDGSFAQYLVISQDSNLGTYFGHTMAASDLNNDGFEDLIISAPLYTDRERNVANGWEVGKVYIYYNDQQGGFTDNLGSAVGNAEGCRYGYSLAAIGDINQDGFNDLAVGAPFCGGGEDGKVFIYHGNGRNSPIELSPKQILSPSTINRPLTYFGFALSGGLDVDENTYPDIAVGAHESQSVILFRTRPVILPVGEISFSPQSLNLDVKNGTTEDGNSGLTVFDVAVSITCNGEELNSAIEFSYTLQLDTVHQVVNRRAAFLSTSQFSLEGTITISAGRNETNLVHQAYISPTIIDKQTPISVSLEFQLLDNDQSTSVMTPVMSDATRTHVVNSIPFARECVGDVCLPDLRVQATSDVTHVTLGTSQRINVDVIVTNKGEDAFLSVLEIHEPEGVYFVTVGRLSTGAFATCNFDGPSRIRTCNIGNPIKAGDSVAFFLCYHTETYSTFRGNVSINLHAHSSDDEEPSKISDNSLAVEIPVYATANLTLQGIPNPERLVVKEADYPSDRNRSYVANIGPQMSHIISLSNAGPSFIGTTVITILWPKTLASGTGITTQPTVTMNTGDTCSVSSIRTIDVKETPLSANTMMAIHPRNNSTQTILIIDRNTASECFLITCRISSLGTGATAGTNAVVIDLEAYVDADSLLAETSIDAVQFASSVSVDVTGSIYPDVSFRPYPTVEPIDVDTFLTFEFEKALIVQQKSPPWVYIVSSIGGFLILVIIIVVLYYVGFFKRRKLSAQQKEQLRQSIRQSQHVDGDQEKNDDADTKQEGVYENSDAELI